MVLPGRPKYVLDFCGAKSRNARCRSKGMAGRGLVSGGDPRSGEDERSEPFDGTWHPGGDTPAVTTKRRQPSSYKER